MTSHPASAGDHGDSNRKASMGDPQEKTLIIVPVRFKSVTVCVGFILMINTGSHENLSHQTEFDLSNDLSCGFSTSSSPDCGLLYKPLTF